MECEVYEREEPRVNLQMVDFISSGSRRGSVLPPAAGILSACLGSPPPSGDVQTTYLNQLGEDVLRW